MSCWPPSLNAWRVSTASRELGRVWVTAVIKTPTGAIVHLSMDKDAQETILAGGSVFRFGPAGKVTLTCLKGTAQRVEQEHRRELEELQLMQDEVEERRARVLRLEEAIQANQVADLEMDTLQVEGNTSGEGTSASTGARGASPRTADIVMEEDGVTVVVSAEEQRTLLD
ncbi:MAG: hypothetical protein HC888_03820 [Candidatus Competibacteraceae bacterium]|nr:hypothetical protein [Candidatus Competibacteraceae bacterium]